jgi:hypothetical protein
MQAAIVDTLFTGTRISHFRVQGLFPFRLK